MPPPHPREPARSSAAHALAIALEHDPTLRERNDEAGLRGRLHDAELLVERLALAVAAGDPTPLREYADWTAAALSPPQASRWAT